MSITTFGWDGTPKGAAAFATVQVSVSALSGGDTIAIYGSGDNTNFTVLSGTNLATAGAVTSIAANGIYSFPATGYVKYIRTGAVSTPVVNILMKR